jgi:transposase
MTGHRSHSAGFRRQVAEEFLAGETLHGLSQRHDISRQLIRSIALRSRGRQVRGGRPG